MSLLERLAYASFDVLLVAGAVWAFCVLLRPASARLRSLLWLLVPAKGLVALVFGAPLVLFSLPSSPPVEPAPTVAFATAMTAQPVLVTPAGMAARQPAATAPGPVDPSPFPLDPVRATWTAGAIASLLWALGALSLLALSVRDRLLGARLVGRSSRAGPAWRDLVRRHAAVLGVRAPGMRVTTELESPALVGALRPVILIPSWMTSTKSVEWAVRHELMHLRLRDPWAALVREVARMAFFFHPAIWLAHRRWDEAAELACDRALVGDEAESLDYAERLHALAGRVCRRPNPTLAHGLFAAGSRVGRRIEALAAPPAGPARLSRGVALGLALLSAATLCAGAGVERLVLAPNDFELRGRVVGPDGEPVPGVEVVASIWSSAEQRTVTLATASADGQGDFFLGYDKSDLPFDEFDPQRWRSVQLSAYHEGFGPDVVRQGDLTGLEDIQLRLAPDTVLRGRLVDEDGRPLVGARVTVISLSASVEGSLDPWIRQLEAGVGALEARSMLKKYLELPADRSPVARTDKDGQFELRGVGAERLLFLEFVGGDAAHGVARMASRVLDADLLELANRSSAESMRGFLEPIHGSGTTIVARRTRPIEGVVLDAVSGEPMAGVDVFSHTIGRNGMAVLNEGHSLRAKTNAQGRFRMLGMAKCAGNSIVAVPGDDQPYFMREVSIPDPPGTDPVRIEVRLTRGIWITGRVIDAGTGGPGQGRVVYHPHLFNPAVQEIDQFKDQRLDGFEGRYHTAADGTFRIVGLPGPGFVSVDADGPYRRGVGFDRSWELDEEGSALALTFGGPGLSATWPSSMVKLDLADDATSAQCLLGLDPGVTLDLAVVDPEGEPVAGLDWAGASGNGGPLLHVEGSRVSVAQLGSREQRLIWVRARDRGLGLVTRTRPRADQPRSLTLEPTAKIRGRLLDRDGAPLEGARVVLYVAPEEIPFDLTAISDGDGRFTLDGALVGCDYLLYLIGPRFMYGVAQGISVTAGELTELGDLRVGVR
jgi:beta-lactamase regulating signal transducer with metallopeptidase domain